MEITFKFIIDRVHPKKNLTLPVRLRLYFNRDFKQHSLGFAVLPKDWDEQLQQVLPSNPDHLSYNTKIASIRSKIQKFLLLNEDNVGLIPVRTGNSSLQVVTKNGGGPMISLPVKFFDAGFKPGPEFL